MEKPQLGVKLKGVGAGHYICCNVVLVADSGAELQAMLDVVDAYVSRWKISLTEERARSGSGEEGSKSELEDGEEIVEEVEK